MDNFIVFATGATCFTMAQFSTNWIESASPLGIIAIVVYFFLTKFDKKLDAVENATREIKSNVEEIKTRIEQERNTCEEHNSIHS